MAILKSLNPEQKKAVLCTDGPVLIIAGAGSGKTRVLTRRIAYLIKEKNIPAQNILAVTFTNKAADELKHRLNHLVGILSKNMWVGTFHSICGRILRVDIDKLGIEKNFVIFDTDDQKSLMKQVIKELNLDDKRYKPLAMLDSISKAKNELIKYLEYGEKAADIWEEKAAQCYKLYQEKLRLNNALDFDDMLMYTVELLETYEKTRQHYQNKFKYINVDEYQDTNHAQYMITKLLAGFHKNICVVGDDDQSIYGFRGADVSNILDFEKDYPNAQIFKLEENYRSTQNILNAANNIIANNTWRKTKSLWTSNTKGEKIVSYQAKNERDEAQFIAGEIKKTTKGPDLNKIAILYRTNAQSRVLEETLLQEGLPYKIISGFRFYERKEIKDLMALLRLIYNPLDSLSLVRSFGFMLDGIGKATISKIEKEAADRNISMFDMLHKIEEPCHGMAQQVSIANKAKTKFMEFIRLIESYQAYASKNSASDIVRKIIDETRLTKDLEAEGTEESLARVENIKEFLSVVIEYEKNTDETNLGDFLAHISLVTDQDSIDNSRSYVTLMTMHAAKGLEYPIVFIAGMEEGIFPHYRAMFEPKEIEEERRLCYVAVTRAKEKLYICNAAERMLFGESWCNGPSRFAEEIPKELINQINPAPEDRGWINPKGRENETGHVYIPSDIENLYSLGDTVNHPKWGTGEVVKIDGGGEDIEIQVFFANLGKKTLMLKYAPIQKQQ